MFEQADISAMIPGCSYDSLSPDGLDDWRFHHDQALALVKARKLDEAIQAFQKAVRSAPDRIELRLDLAHALMDLKREHEAIEQLKLGLSLQPENTSALNDLGLALTAAKRFSEALVYLRHAIRVDPSHCNAHNNLGVALSELGRRKEAEAAYARALELNPQSVEAQVNMATFCAHNGRLPEARGGFDLALWNKPADTTARLSRALALLSYGQYEEGFAEHEVRLQMVASPRQFHQLMWDGSDLTARSILLWQEQGLGDSIQFIRYAALVKARGAARVIVECQPPLTRLFETCAGIDGVIAAGAPAGQRPHFDVHAPLMSLPKMFGTTLATVPADVPYLTADAALVEKWRVKLANGSGLRIGIAWQGNPKHKWDHHRSVPPGHFAPGRIAGCPALRPSAR